MKIWIPRSREELKQHLKDPLFKNAYFLMLSSITSACSGFFFWLIAARFYSPEDVGLASALISAMGLIGMLSLLGFDISLVRFLPERRDKADLINTCLTISFLLSLLLSLIFIAGINIWSPSLNIVRKNKILLALFVVFTIIAPLSALLSRGVFVGFRKTEYSFMQTVVTFARIGIIPFLTAFGALGIYGAYGLTSVLALILGIFLISRIFSYRPIPAVKREIIRDIFSFSFGNYVAGMFSALPGFVLPLMVINMLGAEENAYFFIAWATAGLLLIIPRATSMSLLTEGSYNRDELGRDVRRSMKFIFILLGIAIAGVFLFGKYLLWIFGEEYARNSFELLLILAFGSIPFSINALYATIKRVQKEIKPVIWVYGGIAIITLAVSYLLIQAMGIIGAGIGWVIGNGVVAIFIGLKYSLHKSYLPQQIL